MKTNLTNQLEAFPGHSAWLESDIENEAEWNGTRSPKAVRLVVRTRTMLKLADKLRAGRRVGASILHRCPCGRIDSFIGLLGGTLASSLYLNSLPLRPKINTLEPTPLLGTPTSLSMRLRS
jgi:hypothetical protein